jgi:hypothetical protein
MLGWSMYSKIQQYKELGFNKSQIAGKLEINIKTVRKYWVLRPEEMAEMKYQKRNSKYSEYEGVMVEIVPWKRGQQNTSWREGRRKAIPYFVQASGGGKSK